MLEIWESFPLGILRKSNNTITKSKKKIMKMNVIEGMKMEVEKYNLFCGSKLNLLLLPNDIDLMEKGTLRMKL